MGVQKSRLLRKAIQPRKILFQFALIVNTACSVNVLSATELVDKSDNKKTSATGVISAQNYKRLDLKNFSIPSLKSLNEKGVNKGALFSINMRAFAGFSQSSQRPNQYSDSSVSQRFTQSLRLSLPLPNGDSIDVNLEKNNLIDNLNLTDIATFNILPSHKVLTGKLEKLGSKIKASIRLRDGQQIYIDHIEPDAGDLADVVTQSPSHISYKASEQIRKISHMHCEHPEEHQKIFDFRNREKYQRSTLQNSTLQVSHTSQARTALSRSPNEILEYRLAVATTAEFTQKKGGKANALASVISTINRVNQIFEHDLGIRFKLISQNESLIYTNSNSDPYSNNGSMTTLMLENQRNLDAVIGKGNYDLGHLFTSSSGGIAIIGSACANGAKAMGISGLSGVSGDRFDVDYVAHELGHQLAATHSFNSELGACSGGNKTEWSAFEPGSGSSIMSYAGICAEDNIQSYKDPMFHIGSIEQINYFINYAEGSQCGAKVAHAANNIPAIHAGEDYKIPSRTPFELEASLDDGFDSSEYVYAWQQVDVGRTAPVNSDFKTNSLYRIYPLKNELSRIFPALPAILGEEKIAGETFPEQDRVLNFKVIASNGSGNVTSDRSQIEVIRTGSRFALHVPYEYYTRGQNYDVLWNVAATDLSPINCSNVDLSLSTNNAKTFDYMIGENLPNNGSALVKIPPEIPKSSNARFKLKCSDNVFFALSSQKFEIGDNVRSYSELNQPEDNLLDRSIDEIENTSTVNVENQTEQIIVASSVGGGPMNGVVILLLFILKLLIRRSKYS